MRRSFALALIAVWVLAIGQLTPAAGAADEINPPDFHNILLAYGDQLETLTSATQAKSLFRSLAPPLGLIDLFSTPLKKGEPQSAAGATAQNSVLPDANTLGVKLMADLATWRLLTALKHAADIGAPAEIRSALQRIELQRIWLLEEITPPLLPPMINLALVLSSFSGPESISSDPLPDYAAYAGYMNRAYPRLTTSEDSWIASAEREGIDGIQRRLSSYWQQSDANGLLSQKADGHLQETVAARYVQLHLRPALTSHLVALAIRAEAEAEQHARNRWFDLRTWQERRRVMRGLARLCGTWQWTVHNHQNHQDHKMTMVFPPPNGESTTRARPAKITVLGDGVYLRWEFQGGYQEDSLLFTGEGSRLEGSFMNSAGAWGSITGKRIGACGK
ncbi:MAG: hypothetical protein ACREJU_04160 [Nitrospiraceae bacterium]